MTALCDQVRRGERVAGGLVASGEALHLLIKSAPGGLCLESVSSWTRGGPMLASRSSTSIKWVRSAPALLAASHPHCP